MRRIPRVEPGGFPSPLGNAIGFFPGGGGVLGGEIHRGWLGGLGDLVIEVLVEPLFSGGVGAAFAVLDGTPDEGGDKTFG
jgi:hypothetical protein